jgi:DNA polymerase-3 subunit alpha
LYDTEHHGVVYGSWSQGHGTGWADVVSITNVGEEDVFDLCMASDGHNFVGNGIVLHNSVAYGMLGYWTMYIKQHHTSLFYSAALQTMDKKKHQDLIRDAARHHIEIRAPHPKYSGVTWKREGDKAIRAGYEQIPGIGSKTGAQIAAFAETEGLEEWSDLSQIKGIGAKTIEKAQAFSEADDPFGAMWLDRTIAKVKKELAEGQLWGHDRRGKFIRLPHPTHVASDMPYSRGQDLDVVWLGTVHTRNVRDIFEYNRAKTGVELKPEDIKDPHLNEWMVMVGDDESDQMGLRVDRWTYPKYRDALWGMRPGEDLLLVRGIKPGWMPTRQITIRELWVLRPE